MLKKLKKEKREQISSIAVMHDGKLLFGKRRDSGKWTLPGGHAEKDEVPSQTAVRELEEETGIEAKEKELEYLGNDNVVNEKGKKLRINCFLLETKEATTTKEDPDEENEGRWLYRDIKNGLPEDVANNLHAKKNVTLKLLGLQKSIKLKLYYNGENRKIFYN